jgi:primase-polymerase (primpol)-like protein
VFGVGAPPGHGCKNVPLGLELYTSGRFVALTGTNAIGSAGTDCSAALPGLVASYFPAKAPSVVSDWTDAPVPEWSGPDDDAALIEKMLGTTNAAGAFGSKPSGVAALWAGDTSGHHGDASAADAALAQHLAFWTGSDCERIRRLMLQSELASCLSRQRQRRQMSR